MYHETSGPDFFTLAFRSTVFPGAMAARVARETEKNQGSPNPGTGQVLTSNTDLSELIEYSQV